MKIVSDPSRVVKVCLSLSRNVTGVPAVGHDFKGQPGWTVMTSALWLHADSTLCVAGTAIDSAQPTPSICEAIQAIDDRDVIGTDDATEAVVEPAGLGARHSSQVRSDCHGH